MLGDIVRLSHVRLAHSANQDVPIKFFHTARDDNNNLRDVLLNAILDDCRTTDQDTRLTPTLTLALTPTLTQTLTLTHTHTLTLTLTLALTPTLTQTLTHTHTHTHTLSLTLTPTLTTDQAIRLAVEWGDATITRSQLQESSQVNPNSLRVELETALLAADYELIKVHCTPCSIAAAGHRLCCAR